MRVGDVDPARGGAMSSRSDDTFEVFYRSEYRMVLALAAALCRDRHAAEDVTQDAFVALHRRWHKVRHYDDPGAWVRRVVANRSVSRWRRLRSETNGLLRLGLADEVPAPTMDSPDVWAAVRALPRRQAQVIALTYLDDLSVRDVAQVLGIDEPTVKTHLQRARRTLARTLAVIDEDGPA